MARRSSRCGHLGAPVFSRPAFRVTLIVRPAWARIEPRQPATMHDARDEERTKMPHTAAAGFRLMRYFTLSTATAFIAVGAALYFLQRSEEAFFDQVQQQQAAYFRQAQEELARQHEEAALATMLAVHEANHVTLTRLVANLMWDSDIAPFMGAAQRVRIADCVSLPVEPLAARRRCWGDVGQRIAALPTFKALDAKAYE